MDQPRRVAGSFRDPSGFVFRRDGVLFRQINRSYQADYELLRDSGLMERLQKAGLLVESSEVSPDLAVDADALAVLKPRPLPFISYPYEWSFGMLKDAALLTLEIQDQALDAGMVLKDATAFNVQFDEGRPVFIDTLSFERRLGSEPWIAYGQFCRHFLAPLALMARVDVRLGALLGEHLDGIPLTLAARLLPRSTRWVFGILTHIHLHAAAEGRPGGSNAQDARVSMAVMKGLVRSLRKTVAGLHWEPRGTEWASYYSDTNYSDDAEKHKADTVARWLQALSPTVKTCWDLGANNGRYSRLAIDAGLWTLAADIDPAAVEQAYRSQSGVHPLLVDLRNPSPSRGWDLGERTSLFERGPADVALALALVHHLAIGNNVPFSALFESLLRCGRTLIVEWVPKDDSQVQRMMVARRDVFADYTEEAFVQAIPASHRVRERIPIRGSGRVLYLVTPA